MQATKSRNPKKKQTTTAISNNNDHEEASIPAVVENASTITPVITTELEKSTASESNEQHQEQPLDFSFSHIKEMMKGGAVTAIPEQSPELEKSTPSNMFPAIAALQKEIEKLQQQEIEKLQQQELKATETNNNQQKEPNKIHDSFYKLKAMKQGMNFDQEIYLSMVENIAEKTQQHINQLVELTTAPYTKVLDKNEFLDLVEQEIEKLSDFIDNVESSNSMSLQEYESGKNTARRFIHHLYTFTFSCYASDMSQASCSQKLSELLHQNPFGDIPKTYVKFLCQQAQSFASQSSMTAQDYIEQNQKYRKARQVVKSFFANAAKFPDIFKQKFFYSKIGNIIFESLVRPNVTSHLLTSFLLVLSQTKNNVHDQNVLEVLGKFHAKINEKNTISYTEFLQEITALENKYIDSFTEQSKLSEPFQFALSFLKQVIAVFHPQQLVAPKVKNNERTRHVGVYNISSKGMNSVLMEIYQCFVDLKQVADSEYLDISKEQWLTELFYSVKEFHQFLDNVEYTNGFSSAQLHQGQNPARAILEQLYQFAFGCYVSQCSVTQLTNAYQQFIVDINFDAIKKRYFDYIKKNYEQQNFLDAASITEYDQKAEPYLKLMSKVEKMPVKIASSDILKSGKFIWDGIQGNNISTNVIAYLTDIKFSVSERLTSFQNYDKTFMAKFREALNGPDSAMQTKVLSATDIFECLLKVEAEFKAKRCTFSSSFQQRLETVKAVLFELMPPVEKTAHKQLETKNPNLNGGESSTEWYDAIAASIVLGNYSSYIK